LEGAVTLMTPLERELEPVRALLDETTTMVLATHMPDGTPRATPVFFAADSSLRLVFLSDPKSVHSLNLTRLPEASAAVYPEEADWRRLRGLQMQGRAEALAGAQADDARHIYAQRFPFVNQLAEALAASQIYAFRPSWVRLIDNRRGFGFQQEWALG
jgi:uncharacterized protein